MITGSDVDGHIEMSARLAAAEARVTELEAKLAACGRAGCPSAAQRIADLAASPTLSETASVDHSKCDVPCSVVCDVEAPIVCPGCHAVAPARCAPGCIDAEMAQERERREDNGAS